MRRKYLLLLLIPLLIAFAGCGKKRHYVASPPELEAPSNLTVTAINYKQINLCWQDNSTIEDGFRVCCNMGESQYQTVDTLPANTISFEHYNLQPMTKYTYYIQAYKGNKYANSKEVSASTPCPVRIISSDFYDRGVVGNSLATVSGIVRNNATEPCKAELTATFYGYYTGRKLGSAKTVVTLAASEGGTYSITYRNEERISEDYELEITDVEIEY